MGDFDGLVAVVTGGASGIGAATGRLLLSRGATVAVLDRSYAEVGGADPLQVPCDVTDSESTSRAVATVVERLGRLDVLINNAGIGAVGDITANDDDEWRQVL